MSSSVVLRTLSPVLALALAACSASESEIEPLPAGAMADPKADGDGDGYDSSVDCDDGNSAVNPGASESDNLTDDDCDDWVDEDFVANGDIVVTEINKRSNGGTGGVDNDATWVEVYNTSSRTVSLANWAFVRGTSSFHALYVDPDAAPVLAAGEFAVFCDSNDYEGSVATWPLSCDYIWGDESQPATYNGTYHSNTFYMRRDNDRFALYVNGSHTTGTLIDDVTYYYDAVNGYWPNNARFSLSLDNAYFDSDLNGNKSAWCSTTASSTGAVGASTAWRWYDTAATSQDEYGTPGAANYDCPVDPDLDGDGVTGATDCDEEDATVYPGAPEACDGLDNDCDSIIDEGGGYTDADSDGYGDPAAPTTCGGGGVANADDCDDTDASLNPGAPELDDQIDQDCDGWIDEDYVSVGDIVISEINKRSNGGSGGLDNDASWVELYNTSSRTVDLSNWVFARGTSSSNNEIVIDPADAVSLAPGEYAVLCDSDDYEASVVSYPLSCDYIWGDETQASTFVGTYHDNTLYIRRDADTVGVYIGGDMTSGTQIDSVTYTATWPNNARYSLTLDPLVLDSAWNDASTSWCSTTANSAGAVSGSTTWRWYNTPASNQDEYGTPGAANYDCQIDIDGDGFTTTDCDDTDATVYPGATETCNGIDDDCDSAVDEGAGLDWYLDGDSDGYGDVSITSFSCSAPVGYVADDTDCDDGDATINPGEVEVCNDYVDNDCDPDPTVCEFSGSAAITADYDFRAYGTAASHLLGSSIANNGDFNGDGYDDVAVGQSYHDTSPTLDNGRSWIWYGPVDTSDSTSTADLTINGSTANNYDYFGSASTFAGDVNADSFDDLIVSSNVSHTNNRGTAYLFYGSASPSYSSVTGASASFTENTANAYIGQAIAGGDVDFDGKADVAVSANGRSSSTGAVGVWNATAIGGGAETFSTDASTFITGGAAGDNFGYAIALGDLNGDGGADLVAGSYNTTNGTAYVFTDLDTMTGTSFTVADADATLSGAAVADRFGLAVKVLGDTDFDGQNEFVVTADYTDSPTSNTGSVYVYNAMPSGAVSASSADTIINGQGAVANDYFGRTVAAIGDTNGDEMADMLVGATAFDSGAIGGAGAVYYFYGPFATGTVSANTYDARFTGTTASDAIGYAVSGGGDVNADGYADWMTSATSFDGGGFTNGGGAWMYFGRGE